MKPNSELQSVELLETVSPHAEIRRILFMSGKGSPVHAIIARTHIRRTLSHGLFPTEGGRIGSAVK